jgi:glyoxylase-like metal-dependent hydrolase (beta-lactamase superfamily II)
VSEYSLARILFARENGVNILYDVFLNEPPVRLRAFAASLVIYEDAGRAAGVRKESGLKREIEQIIEGVHKLQFEIPYSVQPVNMYLLEGEPLTLIDTGPIMDEVSETIPRTLAELGFPPSSIERIIITHHHPDHMGLAARFKEVSGGEIVCHRSGLETVGDYWAESLRLREYLVGMSPFLGLDLAMVRSALSTSYQWDDVAEPVGVDRLVEDGDILAGDPYELEVMHTPGHSIDHICLFLRQEGLLFTGDMLLNSITPNPDMYPPWQSEEQSGLPDYIRSLQKIRGLEVRVALPGHGVCVHDFAGRVDEVLSHHEERLLYLLGALGGDEKTVIQLTFEMLEHIEAEPTVENIFLGMREVFGHLVILEQNDSVSHDMREETAYFRAIE